MPPGPRRRLPVPDAWLRPSGRTRPWRDVAAAVVLGWLVLMTVWGFGRSGFPAAEGWFLAGGAAAAAVVIGVGLRRARHRARSARAAPHLHERGEARPEDLRGRAVDDVGGGPGALDPAGPDGRVEPRDGVAAEAVPEVVDERP